MATLLIEKGAEENAKNDRGGTPLWYAQKDGHKELAELLKKHGGKASKPKVILYK